MPKSQLLQELQEYLRTGTRTINKLENWLIKSEEHIRQLEKQEAEQKLIIAEEKIKQLEAKITELEKNPHTALNSSEKKIEDILHRIATAEDYQIGTYIKVLEGLKEWNNTGTDEQRKAVNKYSNILAKNKDYLLARHDKYKKQLGI